jgi:carbon-monoxide dehydrogenase small subunit
MRAFIDEHGLQCGFCTPGFVIRIAKLLEENQHPTRDEIVRELAGNLCRCTGYQGIIRAVEAAARNSEVHVTGMIGNGSVGDDDGKP